MNTTETTPPGSLYPDCSAENIRLHNETKIKFSNAFHAMQNHLGNCEACCEYMYHGDGDLCDKAKDIIARQLCFSDTNIEFLPNDGTQRRRAADSSIETETQSRRSLE